MAQRSLGFTLLELMIVVAVIAVLAMIALPSFSEQLRRGKRTEAIQSIADVRLLQEKWRNDHLTFGTLASVILPATETNFNGALKYYDITVSSNDASNYIITATRKGSMASDPRCGDFVLRFGTDCNAAAAGGVANKCVSSGDADYCWRRN